MKKCKFKKNIGLTDRIIRAAASVVFVGLSAEKSVPSPVKIGLLVLSGVFLATSAVGSCPAYSALDISTKKD